MPDERAHSEVANWVKVTALLGGAAAWTLHLFACYFVVALACSTGWNGAPATVAVLTVVLGALGAAAGVLALRHWRRVQHAESWEHALDEAGGHEGLLFLVGVMLSGLFFVLIVMNGVSPFLLPVCSP